MTEVKNNEVMANENGEVIDFNEVIVQDTPQFTIIKNLQTGKFEKRMKYEKFGTHIPETEDEILLLFKALNDNNNDLTIGMKEAINKEIQIKNFYTNPYQSFDEETGQSKNGVTSMIETPDGQFYVTSSKGVYYDLMNIKDVFGTDFSKKHLTVQICGIKNPADKTRVQIKLSVLGFK